MEKKIKETWNWKMKLTWKSWITKYRSLKTGGCLTRVTANTDLTEISITTDTEWLFLILDSLSNLGY